MRARRSAAVNVAPKLRRFPVESAMQKRVHCERATRANSIGSGS